MIDNLELADNLRMEDVEEMLISSRQSVIVSECVIHKVQRAIVFRMKVKAIANCRRYKWILNIQKSTLQINLANRMYDYYCCKGFMRNGNIF